MNPWVIAYVVGYVALLVPIARLYYADQRDDPYGPVGPHEAFIISFLLTLFWPLLVVGVALYVVTAKLSRLVMPED